MLPVTPIRPSGRALLPARPSRCAAPRYRGERLLAGWPELGRRFRSQGREAFRLVGGRVPAWHPFLGSLVGRDRRALKRISGLGETSRESRLPCLAPLLS